MVGVLSSHQYVIKIGLNGWGSTPWRSTSSMSLSGKLSFPFPLASQVETNLSKVVNIWSQAVVDPWVALVARMAGGPLCRHWRKDIWHMVSNSCHQNTKWFKPRFWPGRFLHHIFPSFFPLPSWLPGQFTIWSSFLPMPGFVRQHRLPLGGRGNRWKIGPSFP